jgi:cell wall-associated NlpC family hydrolase
VTPALPGADPRLTPWNGRVAHVSLRGLVAAEVFTEGTPARIAAPLADLLTAPDGPRTRQLLLGAAFTVLEERGAMAFGVAVRDGYVGWIAAGALAPWVAPSHAVAAAATHLYPAPDLKTPETARLSLGALLTVTGRAGAFAETDRGFAPACHLRPLAEPEPDPVAVAERLLGTPYLWGGNSRDGIDCSGLVQIALHACGRDCPGDSDLQAAALGRPLPEGAPLARGDLVFWPGHVGWMLDAGRLIHANAHHMAVAVEPLAAARARIGPFTARRL